MSELFITEKKGIQVPADDIDHIDVTVQTNPPLVIGQIYQKGKKTALFVSEWTNGDTAQTVKLGIRTHHYP